MVCSAARLPVMRVSVSLVGAVVEQWSAKAPDHQDDEDSADCEIVSGSGELFEGWHDADRQRNGYTGRVPVPCKVTQFEQEQNGDSKRSEVNGNNDEAAHRDLPGPTVW